MLRQRQPGFPTKSVIFWDLCSLCWHNCNPSNCPLSVSCLPHTDSHSRGMQFSSYQLEILYRNDSKVKKIEKQPPCFFFSFFLPHAYQTVLARSPTPQLNTCNFDSVLLILLPFILKCQGLGIHILLTEVSHSPKVLKGYLDIPLPRGRSVHPHNPPPPQGCLRHPHWEE